MLQLKERIKGERDFHHISGIIFGAEFRACKCIANLPRGLRAELVLLSLSPFGTVAPNAGRATVTALCGAWQAK